jgi:hypothetical protein
MRWSSSRIATAAVLVAGLAALAVASRLLPTVPSIQPAPSSSTATAMPQTTRGVRLPDEIGRTLHQAQQQLRVIGLQGRASDQDPESPDALVVAQEPAAGLLLPPGGVVGLRTRTDLQPNGRARRLRLGRGAATSSYPVMALDPVSHQLTGVVTVPRGTDLEVWLEPTPGDRVNLLASTRQSDVCRPHDHNRRVRCAVFLEALAGEGAGAWTAHVVKHSAPSARVEITVAFQRV